MAFNIANYEHRGQYAKYTTSDTLATTEGSNYFAHSAAPLRGPMVVLVVASDGIAIYDYSTAPAIKMADIDALDLYV